MQLTCSTDTSTSVLESGIHSCSHDACYDNSSPFSLSGVGQAITYPKPRQVQLDESLLGTTAGGQSVSSSSTHLPLKRSLVRSLACLTLPSLLLLPPEGKAICASYSHADPQSMHNLGNGLSQHMYSWWGPYLSSKRMAAYLGAAERGAMERLQGLRHAGVQVSGPML